MIGHKERFCRKLSLIWYDWRQPTYRDKTITSFKGRQFKKVIILMAMRWYLSYSLSYRNIEELMAERSVDFDHSTVNRWVINYSPKLEAKFSNVHKKKLEAVGEWMRRI